MDLLFGNSDCCMSSGKTLFVPYVATWHVFCSTSALRIRFQVGLLGAFDKDGVRLGIFDEGGDRLGAAGVVKVFEVEWLEV